MTLARLEGQASPLYIYAISLMAAVGGFLFGYDLQIISGAVLYLRNEFHLNATQEAVALGSATAGCLLGPLLGIWLADSRLGRKWSLMLAAALFLISALGTAFPRNFLHFNVYRLIGGAGVGLASVVSPMYIAEISPARIRGRLVSLNQFAIVFGAFLASLAALYFSKNFSPDVSWRWMFGSECLPILFLMTGLLFIPRSPRWLVHKHRIEEATGVLTKINGRPQAQTEIRAIEESLAGDPGTWRELFQPGLRIALLVAVGLAFFQQWTGVSTMIMYGPIIFEKAGFRDPSEAIGQLVFLNVWNIACTVTAVMVVDKLGRRPLLLWGTAGMLIGQLIMGTLFYFDLRGVYVVIAFYFCLGTFVTSLAPLAWLIMSEVFPTRIRARGMSIGSFTVWISTFSSLLFLGPFMHGLEERFGTPAGAFWCFAAVCAVAWLFSYKLVPETKGKTLEELEELFRPGKRIRLE